MDYIRYDYELKIDLKEIEYVKSKYESIKYLKGKKLLTKDAEKKLIIKLKNILNKK